MIRGLYITWLIAYTGKNTLTDEGYAKAKLNTLYKCDAILKFCKEIAPDRIELVFISTDVIKIDSLEKKVAMIIVKNTYPIGTDLSQFQNYYDLGHDTSHWPIKNTVNFQIPIADRLMLINYNMV